MAELSGFGSSLPDEGNSESPRRRSSRRLKRLSAFSRVTANVFSSEGVLSFLFTSRGVDPTECRELKRGVFEDLLRASDPRGLSPRLGRLWMILLEGGV